MSLITVKSRCSGGRASIYGTAPIFLNPQPFLQQTGCHCVALPTVNLHRFILKMQKCPTLNTSCNREFPAHHAQLLPLASRACLPRQVLLNLPSSLAGRCSDHGSCPPSSHMVHHDTCASPSPFQAEAGHRAKPFQTPSPFLSLLPVCGSCLQAGTWASGFPLSIQTSAAASPPIHSHTCTHRSGRERQEDS